MEKKSIVEQLSQAVVCFSFMMLSDSALDKAMLNIKLTYFDSAGKLSLLKFHF